MKDDQSPLDVYRWYAIQCKGGESLRAAENLHRQQFDIFHPLVERQDGKKRREPLFPYYLFIRLNRIDSNWRPIRSTRGVLRLVAFGAEPTPVPDDLVELLRTHSRQGEADPENHYVALKPKLTSVEQQPDESVRTLLDIRSGEERVIALLNIIARINDPKTL